MALSPHLRKKARARSTTPPKPNAKGEAPAPPKQTKSAASKAARAPRNAGKKSASPSRPAKRTRRNAVQTEAGRRKRLPALPSLSAHPLRHKARDTRDVPVIDADAPPPPPPAPPPAPPPEEAAFVDRGLPIPDTYGTDRVVAMVRDPYWLYVYWELSGGGLERLRFQFSADVMDQARWVLKVEAAHLREQRLVDIDLKANGWYLKVAPGGRYRVELGYLSPQGDFEGLCRSHAVATPRPSLSPLADEDWMIVKEDLKELLEAGEMDVRALGHGEAWDYPPLSARSEHPRAARLFSGGLGMPPPVSERPSG